MLAGVLDSAGPLKKFTDQQPTHQSDLTSPPRTTFREDIEVGATTARRHNWRLSPDVSVANPVAWLCHRPSQLRTRRRRRGRSPKVTRQPPGSGRTCQVGAGSGVSEERALEYVVSAGSGSLLSMVGGETEVRVRTSSRTVVEIALRRVRIAPQIAQFRPPSLTPSQTGHLHRTAMIRCSPVGSRARGAVRSRRIEGSDADGSVPHLAPPGEDASSGLVAEPPDELAE